MVRVLDGATSGTPGLCAADGDRDHREGDHGTDLVARESAATPVRGRRAVRGPPARALGQRPPRPSPRPPRKPPPAPSAAAAPAGGLGRLGGLSGLGGFRRSPVSARVRFAVRPGGPSCPRRAARALVVPSFRPVRSRSVHPPARHGARPAPRLGCSATFRAGTVLRTGRPPAPGGLAHTVGHRTSGEDGLGTCPGFAPCRPPRTPSRGRSACPDPTLHRVGRPPDRVHGDLRATWPPDTAGSAPAVLRRWPRPAHRHRATNSPRGMCSAPAA